MKKIMAIFMAMAFALTLGVAFAQETAPAPEKKMEQKTPAKHKKHKAHKKVKKESAAPATEAPATK